MLGATDNDPGAMSPLQLAYVGDSVYDLMVRTHLLKADRKLRVLHHDATCLVNAAAQARALAAIMGQLTEEEADLVRRGKNAHARHQAPRSATTADYSASTALEALFGYLYISRQEERLCALFDIICGARKEEANA